MATNRNAKSLWVLFALLILPLLVLSKAHSETNGNEWIRIDEGLYVGEFIADKESVVGDSRITVIRIDPRQYEFRLLLSSEFGHANRTAKQWCDEYGLIGTINAGMFQTDYRSNVGYMKNFNHINNPKVSSRYLSVAAFIPIDCLESTPFRIFDIDEHDISDIIKRYHTVIQNLRLIKRPASNRWSRQNRKWSEAALGQDTKGNALWIFSRSPYSMHDLINILKRLPIDIDCAQHLEGGPEASLYLSHNGYTIKKMGSFETGFRENDDNYAYWPIPNVIGFVKKD